MKQFQKAALLVSILPAMVLTACSNPPTPVFRTPALNVAEQQRLTCVEFPEIRDALRDLPVHVFLSGSDGMPVITPDGRKWVRFDIVNDREAILVTFADIDARTAHFECRDDLEWLGGVWTELQADD